MWCSEHYTGFTTRFFTENVHEYVNMDYDGNRVYIFRFGMFLSVT